MEQTATQAAVTVIDPAVWKMFSAMAFAIAGLAGYVVILHKQSMRTYRTTIHENTIAMAQNAESSRQLSESNKSLSESIKTFDETMKINYASLQKRHKK